MFTVCDPPGEDDEDQQEDQEREAAVGSALRDLVLQPMESATECVTVTAGQLTGAAQPGTYTVTWNRSARIVHRHMEQVSPERTPSHGTGQP